MERLSFNGDPRKERANRRKPGISFLEAQSVFLDDFGKLLADPDHSQRENRFVLIGLSTRRQLLVVCRSYRDHEIRLISASRPSRREQRQYWQFNS
jgi:uncharacterized DUF497 family protein